MVSRKKDPWKEWKWKLPLDYSRGTVQGLLPGSCSHGRLQAESLTQRLHVQTSRRLLGCALMRLVRASGGCSDMPKRLMFGLGMAGGKDRMRLFSWFGESQLRSAVDVVPWQRSLSFDTAASCTPRHRCPQLSLACCFAHGVSIRAFFLGKV